MVSSLAMAFTIRVEGYGSGRDAAGGRSCRESANVSCQPNIKMLIPITGPSPSSSRTNCTFNVVFGAAISTLFLGVSPPSNSLFLFFSLMLCSLFKFRPGGLAVHGRLKIARSRSAASAI